MLHHIIAEPLADIGHPMRCTRLLAIPRGSFLPILCPQTKVSHASGSSIIIQASTSPVKVAHRSQQGIYKTCFFSQQRNLLYKERPAMMINAIAAMETPNIILCSLASLSSTLLLDCVSLSKCLSIMSGECAVL
mmetsp:Transcript_94669/g.187584  ORF Transcript_94669/g.187584 Transcript_94669/m.187584 type:complete len:134 (+) Transcript_94669:180-581(+)